MWLSFGCAVACAGGALAAGDAAGPRPNDFGREPAPEHSLLKIPGGAFQMGDSFAMSQDAMPVHAVETDPFLMDRYETTVAQMRSVLQFALAKNWIAVANGKVFNATGDRKLLLDLSNEESPMIFSGGAFQIATNMANTPCVWVTWHGAMAYCFFRTAMENESGSNLTQCVSLADWSCDFSKTGYRLPTEAEWEKAARGPQTGQQFPWPSPGTNYLEQIDPSKANYIAALEESGNGPRPVGHYQRIFGPLSGYVSFGLCDMAGNVAEWCWDWYDAREYLQFATNSWPRNPTGPPGSLWDGRAMRGGSWFALADHLRCAHRSHMPPEMTTMFTGFRTVRRETPGDSGAPQISREAGGSPALASMIEQEWKEADMPEIRRGEKPDYRIASLRALLLVDRTLALVRKQSAGNSEKLQNFQKRFMTLSDAATKTNDEADRERIYFEARRLRRQIIFFSPLLDFDSIIFAEGIPPRYTSNIVDSYLGRWSRTGAGIVRLDHWRENPKPVFLTQRKLPPGAVQNLDLSFDAKKIVFSFCDHSATNNDARAFRLFEVASDGSSVRPFTGIPGRDPLRGEDGCTNVIIEDFDPCWLPDGGVAFMSTRCESFSRCQVGRYAPSFVLYRADADGSKIRRLAFMESNEWSPCVLNDGRLMFTQWDYVNRHEVLFQGLWTLLPDGTGISHFYGNYTANPCAVMQAQPLPRSDKIAAVASAHHSIPCGSLMLIDPAHGTDDEAPLTRLSPEICFPESEGWPDGNYSFPFPLGEDLFLVAFSPDHVPFHWELGRRNACGIYLFDTAGGRELIYRDADESCFKPLPLRPRARPPVLNGLLPSANNATDAVVFVQNVYNSVQTLEPGSIKRIRVVRLYEQRPQMAAPASANQIEFLKRIEGSAPVAPDGSAAFHIPAGVPFLFQLLDQNDMSVFSMRSQLFLQSGERRGCIGCHEPRTSTMRARPRAMPTKFAPLDPPAGPRYEGGMSFERTVQPVFDRYCIRCHGLEKTAGNLNLLGTPQGLFSTAYEQIMSRPGWTGVAWRRQESFTSKPLEYGSHASEFVKIVRKGEAKNKRLDPESFRRIIEWFDLNCQFYGDYGPARPQRNPPSPEGEKNLREHVAQTCGICHAKLSGQSLAALVNVALPEESRVLEAPLAVNAGGWAQCKGLAWPGANSDGYQTMLQKILATLPQAGERNHGNLFHSGRD